MRPMRSTNPARFRTVFLRGVRLKCPCCGMQGIYDGLLKVKKSCKKCRFPLAKHDAADGPAYAAMFLVGIVVTIAALWVEATYHPPLWVHALLWTPSILLGSIALLIVSKSLFIAMQFYFRREDFS